MIFFRVLLPILLIPTGFYLYVKVIHGITYFRNKIISDNQKLLIAFFIIILLLPALHVKSVYALFLIHMMLLSLLLDFIHLFLRTWNFMEKLYRSCIIPILCAALLISYGYVHMQQVRMTTYAIQTKKNIPKKGYRIALLSDLHYGSGMSRQQLKEHIERIRAQQIDLVALAGDIVDEETSLHEMQEAIHDLSVITSTFGIYYVYGNHDKATYAAQPQFSEQQLKETLQNAGIHILEDSSVDIDGHLRLVGRADKSQKSRKATELLLQDVDHEQFILLMDHQPTAYEENRKAGVDLELSGHTHGGQIFPLGSLSDLLGFYDLVYGYTKKADFQAIVTSGIAGWGYPIRTQSQSEYVIIEIKPS